MLKSIKMLITLPRSLEDEIKKFCEVNGVTEYNDFFVSCIRNGFNIAKFGTSPMDNFNKENKPFKIDEINIRQSEKKELAEENQTNGSEQKESVKPKEKRKVKIIKK